MPKAIKVKTVGPVAPVISPDTPGRPLEFVHGQFVDLEARLTNLIHQQANILRYLGGCEPEELMRKCQDYDEGIVAKLSQILDDLNFRVDMLVQISTKLERLV